MKSVILPEGVVHIWRVDLGTWSGSGDELDAAERARAARFRFPDIQRRWIAGRAVLRQLLERYTGIPAAEMCFARGEFGKPYLAGSRVYFNMSDSRDVALYAVTLDAEIGVDVERIRDIQGVTIARRFLPEAEAAAVDDDPACFFRIWTRREAYLKCIGVGLRRLDLPIAPGFSVADLEPHPGYAGAAVWEGAPRTIVVRDF
ncbi:MAG TPA: 4'-phosphopantetheinyl transferase superfamily protein [Bryobacteraceae bacterium]|nr:4'-phosphopantetheinyl transferase superfamily protein [Bryobacteraceae bacterium]